MKNLKYYLSGARTISIHSDPADKENDTITEVDQGTKVEIISDEPYYGWNNRPYIKVKFGFSQEGYVLQNLIRKKDSDG